ncbi:MAG TPA: TIGR03936 family radical SAM-associated protein [Bacillota bacterium]|nr:TIGR03936 family radical SAM-associated protein [Bacillota bacterium]
MRLWLKFSRRDSLSFISHLDAHRAYYRLFRRAGLPLAYSQGFNPHPILSLASPLPLGFISRADYLDLELSQDMDLVEIRDRVNGAAGGDALKLLDCVEITGRVKALAGMLSFARYTIRLRDEDLAAALACRAFVEATTVPFTKQTKSQVLQLDARQLVRELSCEPYVISAVLSLGESRVFRPDELLSVLGRIVGHELVSQTIVREELYIGENTLHPPLTWAKMERG